MLFSIYLSIIIGLFVLLIAIFIKKNYKLRFFLGLLGICLLFYGSYGYMSMNPVPIIETFDVANKRQIDYPIQKVEVISPTENDTVQCRNLTIGVYPEGHKKDIWVLLQPSDNFYYPQSDNTNTTFKNNGRWQVITRFGGSKNENYKLLIYETNSDASQFFTETIQIWKAKDKYPGLTKEELPKDIKKVDEINITLAKDCKDVF